jgi:N utilization substance protein B
MGYRRRSREIALQILYQIDLTGDDIERAIELFWMNFKHREDAKPFTLELVRGVWNHRSEIDSLIETASRNWKLSRMSSVDKNILRISVFEIIHCDDIPHKVTINEAVDLGKKYGSEDSGSFINGILDFIVSEIVKEGILEPATFS